VLPWRAFLALADRDDTELAEHFNVPLEQIAAGARRVHGARRRATRSAALQGTIIVLDGHVLEAAADPDDPDRVRLVITPALGPPPGRDPDHREIVINAPRDMKFGTARPQNIDLAPLPERQ
jgi:hypothetical protein